MSEKVVKKEVHRAPVFEEHEKELAPSMRQSL